MWVAVDETWEKFFRSRYKEYPSKDVRTHETDGKVYYIHHVDDMPGDEWLMAADYDPGLSFAKPSEEAWNGTCKANHT